MNFHVISHLISQQEALLGGGVHVEASFMKLTWKVLKYNHCVIWQVGVQQHLT